MKKEDFNALFSAVLLVYYLQILSCDITLMHFKLHPLFLVDWRWRFILLRLLKGYAGLKRLLLFLLQFSIFDSKLNIFIRPLLCFYCSLNEIIKLNFLLLYYTIICFKRNFLCPVNNILCLFLRLLLILHFAIMLCKMRYRRRLI